MKQKKAYCIPQVDVIRVDLPRLLDLSLNQQGNVQSADIAEEEYDEGSFVIF
jgi:hypothetical protein